MISAISTLSSPMTSLDNASVAQFLATAESSEHSMFSDRSPNAQETRRSIDELYSRSAALSTPNEFLGAATLSDSTDKILPSDQTIAQQAFVNPQGNNEFFTSVQGGDVSSTSASIDSALNRESTYGMSDLNTSATAALSSRAFTQPVLAPVVSAQPSRNDVPATLLGGSVFSTEVVARDMTLDFSTTESRGTAMDIKVGVADKIPVPLLNMY